MSDYKKTAQKGNSQNISTLWFGFTSPVTQHLTYGPWNLIRMMSKNVRFSHKQKIAYQNIRRGYSPHKQLKQGASQTNFLISAFQLLDRAVTARSNNWKVDIRKFSKCILVLSASGRYQTIFWPEPDAWLKSPLIYVIGSMMSCRGPQWENFLISTLQW